MTLDIQPYPHYRTGGLPWASEIPAHWTTERAKWLFAKVSRPVAPNDEVVTCFRDGTVTLRRNRRLDGFTEALKEIGYQGVSRGDLVIHAMDAFAGAVGVSDSDGKCTPVYAICVPRGDASPQYYAYIVREMARSQWIAALSKGIRERSTDFRYEGFADQVVPLPPPDEQETIVRFLAHCDRRINRLIRAKRRLIELLNEQKQAIIHQAVTRGLDPGVPLKASGIDWLGDIPAHWDLCRVKNVLREVDVRSATGKETHLSMSQRHGLIPNAHIEGRTFVSESYVGGKVCEVGDIVLNRLKAHLGVFALARERGLVSPDYTVLRMKSDALPEYYELLLRTPSCRVEFRRRVKGIVQGFWRLYTDDLYAIPIPRPPVAEQRIIVAASADATERVDAAIDRAFREIDLLREYRTRLVADVVTGKLDVRGVELPPIDGDGLEDEDDGVDAMVEEELLDDELTDDADE